ncbi:hypothetical protein H6G76_01675 [Nostoc sp. FACHB-152]|uniref:hypothetical protein n=1 Tax=unclassified Nostoc TaxID=2593658 RepID=UPI00168644EC|nr:MULTISPECIES: hypothetical protein [unclassified Nostoc]MBD2445881.1 hypothetical protein [Nostoc sp. FACHB-152]MBD2467943.1 hypothetical protein [Nostoc sp. FACHB-145]
MSLGRVLFTNHQLVHFSGSELVTLDLATEFKAQGWDVYVATFIFDGEIEKCFKQNNINVFNILNEPIPIKEFDLFWAHHFPVVIKCLLEDKIKAKSIVLSSLSPYEPLETVPFFHNYADLIVCNSEETKAALSLSSEKENLEKLFVFNNSVPANFFEFSVTRKPQELPTLSKVAVISNHPPQEILDTIKILKKNGIIVDLIGIVGKPVLVNKELLSTYDAVITIGRTVQHCMALKIPVFCYDHFGGPGWLTPENYKLAEWFNYSGRCCNLRLSSEELATEITVNFLAAIQHTSFFQDYASIHYSLVNNIDRVLERIGKDFLSKPYINIELPQTFAKIGHAYRRTLSERELWHTELERSQSQLQQTQAELARSQSQLQQTQAELARSQSQLQQTQAELARSQSQLQQTQAELARSQSQLQQTQAELARSQAAVKQSYEEIIEIENSNVGTIKTVWNKFKPILISFKKMIKALYIKP